MLTIVIPKYTLLPYKEAEMRYVIYKGRSNLFPIISY